MHSTIEIQTTSEQETEHVPDEIIFRFLNGVGNHERKLVLAAEILTNPGHKFSPEYLRDDLDTLQVHQSPWPLTAQHINKFCSRSLSEVGAVIKEEVPVTEDNSYGVLYAANPDYLETKTALTCFLMGWSLKYPAISVQNAFGRTDTHGISMPPQVRYQIYRELLNSPKGVSAGQLNERLGVSNYRGSRNMFTQLKLMEEQGIVTYASKNTGYNPTLEILDVDPPDNETAFDQLSLETRAVYGVMKELGTGVTITANDFVDMAKSLHPDTDSSKLRRIVIGRRDDRIRIPGLGWIEDIDLERSERTSVTIKPEQIEALRELVEGIEAIRIGEKTEDYQRQIRQIINHPESVRALIDKAKRFSPWSNHTQGREEAETEVLGFISEEGEWTLKSIQLALSQRYNRRLTQSAIRTIMSGIVGRGLAQEGLVEVNPHSKRKYKKYTSSK